mgnify:CR=1 FL=1
MPRPGGAVSGRRLGPGAAPLSAARALGHAPGGYALVEDVDGRLAGHRPGRPVRPPPGASGRPGAGRSPPCARRPGRTRWRRAASRRWGRGRSNRRHAALGLLDGSAPPHPLLTEDPGQPRRRGRLKAHGGHLVVHADRTVVQSRAPPEPRAHRGPGREPDRAGGSGRCADGATGARPPPRAPPPSARRRKTQERPCARCPARRQTSSPPRGARHRAIGRSPDEHGDQHCGSYRGSPLNPKPRVSPPGPAEPSPMS